MPTKITRSSSKNDAKILAENLGIEFRQSSIVAIFNVARRVMSAVYGVMPKSWGERVANSSTIANMQARIRALVLWSITNEYKSVLPIATSDKSELYMGYATVNGDMSGGFAPIADVCKTKLFALGRWMNEHRTVKNAIPESVLTKKPGAELEIDKKTGKPLEAEKALMPYEFLDEVIWRIENYGESYDDMMAAPFYYETQKSLAPEQKKAWMDKFFKLQSNAVFKWGLLPPGVIVDAKSISKADYQHPITTRAQWQPRTREQIEQTLAEVASQSEAVPAVKA
jgi:NAD+ synthetase